MFRTRIAILRKSHDMTPPQVTLSGGADHSAQGTAHPSHSPWGYQRASLERDDSQRKDDPRHQNGRCAPRAYGSGPDSIGGLGWRRATQSGVTTPG